MICPMCKGERTVFTREQPGVVTQFGEIKLVVCPTCNGTGEVEMTKEEWLRTATTEELVQAIHLMTTCCYVCGKEGVDYKRCYFRKNCTGPKEIAEWLKEEHK